MRIQQLIDEITRVDGVPPSPSLGKHLKMATSPFAFYRGTAQLFYADIANGTLRSPNNLDAIPLTCVIGDCHTSNFGFLTEEGSHGDTVIFAPNDFDDACVGKAYWDVLRYLTSLQLARIHCEGAVLGEFNKVDVDIDKPVVDEAHVVSAQRAFLHSYISTCERVEADPNVIYEAQDCRPDEIPSKLAKLYHKAIKRSSQGEDFTTKSALAKAVCLEDDELKFRNNRSKFTPLAISEFNSLKQAFAPYMDDNVVDIIERINAGTGSVNMSRYYFLVGPSKPHTEEQFRYCHIVEVKQQRDAAPLAYFPNINPVNTLNAAHLTARCQRRMQRKPDLILDEVEYEDAHYLIRSRHHAKVGIAPEDIAMGNKAVNGGFTYFATLCGYTLALAHCRADRRSTRFAKATLTHLPAHVDKLINAANQYSDQVVSDYHWFVDSLAL